MNRDSKAVVQMKLEFAVKNAFREELECETAEHKGGTNRHFGPARFYVKVMHGCPESGVEAGQIKAYCQGFAEFVGTADPNMYHRCTHCRRILKTAEAFKVVGPIGIVS